MSSVKRVISHPDNVGREYSKLSKVSNEPSDSSNSQLHGPDDGKDMVLLKGREENANARYVGMASPVAHKAIVANNLASIDDVQLHHSTTTSPPSTTTNVNDAAAAEGINTALFTTRNVTVMQVEDKDSMCQDDTEENIENLIEGVSESLSQSKISDRGPPLSTDDDTNNNNNTTTAKENEQEKETNEISMLSRQVSMEDNSQKATTHIILEGESSPSSSVSQNKSESTLSSGTAGNGGYGQWGWFEDVHHDHDALIVQTTEKRCTKNEGNNSSMIKDNSAGDASCENDGKGDVIPGDSEEKKKKKKKKKGLLQFRDAIGNNQLLDDYVEPKKEDGVTQSMAVTAPTYVLEESMSSQKLWKNTAGTRPPQPVEERAFFEKIWSQNFSQSQVSYTIPAEVLTATSPICLSPFADGNFDTSALVPQQDAYNLGGMVHDDKAAAEATLLNRSMGLGGPHNGRKKSPTQSLGPHDLHHTLVNKKVKDMETDDELIVVVRGDNVFGTTVSKSFSKKSEDSNVTVIDTVSISIASYRVVESKKHGKYAQFLVIFCEGTFRDTVGVWKRYSDFDKLSKKVTKHHHESCTSVLAGMHPLAITDDPKDGELLPNAITSWRLLKKRQRWYRCLDAGYLSLKVFLLERFLHDILFESSNPDILREFVTGGVE